MRIIVGNGKVSQAIKKNHDIVLSHKDIEITEEPSVLAKILRRASESSLMSANTVINTAAKINLEWCEEHHEDCWKINTLGPLNLAKACDILGFKFVQISSGCIFDGMETERSYTEKDVPSPASFYAVAKAAADMMVENANLDIPVLTLRPRQIISKVAHPTNMLSKMLALPDSAKFITSQNSITCLEDFSEMIDHLLNINASGIYNCAQRNTLSPYEISRELMILKSGWNPQSISYEDYLRTLTVKRVNTLLDTSKLEKSGYLPREAKQALTWCINNYTHQ
jgi:dTDP-4-dehydrorhamnose reductase